MLNWKYGGGVEMGTSKVNNFTRTKDLCRNLEKLLRLDSTRRVWARS